MINSLCGSMGTVKSNEITSISCKQQPTSPTVSVSESNNVVTTSGFEQGDQLSHPPTMPYQVRIKFEGDAQDVAVQSPDNSIWESIYSDQIDLSDFMILSPRRDYMVSSPKTDCMMVSSPKRGDYYYMVSSPKWPDYMISSPKREQLIFSSSPKRAIPGMAHSGYNHHNYSYVQRSMNGQSVDGCSIPSSYNSVQMGGYSKGKSQSPLHKVFNSSDNEFVHHQPESLLLPAIDGFLDDYHRDRDTFVGGPQQQLMKAVGCGGESFDMVLPSGMLDCSSMTSSRFCGPTNESTALGLQMSQEIRDDVYQLSSFVDAADEEAFIGAPHAPLRIMHPKKQQPQQSLEQLLMAPIPTSGTEQEQDSGLELVHLLLACAEAVAKDDYLSARRCLHHLSRVVSPVGDSMQRVASCFTDALADRLTAATAANTSNPPKPFPSYPPTSLEIHKIYQILYQACPYIKFAHFTANQAIFEAFEAEERVHVIDLDIVQGYQWPAFMQALAARPGGPPFLRITGVGTPLESVRETGRRLSDLAHSLHVPFEFHPVGERLVNLKPHMFNRRVGEALAVNSVIQLHRVPPGVTLSNLISMIRDQAPNIVTLVEQEASHNGPYFLGRFLEALHYYSAIFDSLDATFPSDSPERAKVEHYLFAPEIRNIVACEGSERIERHEKLDKWRKIMEGKGFKSVPLSSNAVTQSKILLGLYPCDGYRLTEDKGCLLLGWQDRAIVAASAWRC